MRIAAPTPTTQQAQNKNQRPLFDSRLPSSIEITTANKKEATELIAQKVTEGWRWISAGFINDDDYDPGRGYFTGYRVVEQDNKPEKIDFKNVDIVLLKKPVPDAKHEGKFRKVFFFINSKGNVEEGKCSARWGIRQLKNYFNQDKNSEKFELPELPSNPVLKACQMPSLEEGDRVVTQGKTLRLIKAFDTSAIEEWKQQTTTITESNVTGIGLNSTEDFFKDSYARLAGAYIRRLERMSFLKETFAVFFNTESIRENVEVRLATGRDAYRVSGTYNSYHKVTLNNDVVLTANHLVLLKKALGINIDPAQLNEKSTIENTIPFKKVLEILTFYNKDYNHPTNIPILVCFHSLVVRGRGAVQAGAKIEFLLNAEQSNLNQLTISREKERGVYTGNAYPYWLGYPTSAPDAATADLVLNQPFAQSKAAMIEMGDAKRLNLIEFLACTQIVEAHATPGYLKTSRVPGEGKHARSIIRKAKETHQPLSDFFVAKNLASATEFYPMAATKGTSNGRNAVNELTRIERVVQNKKDSVTVHSTNSKEVKRTVKNEKDNISITIRRNNAPDYDMSEDSDVEFL